MAKTGIEWCDSVWNPITGCSKISEGCQNCYAERMAKWLAGRYGYPKDDPFKVTFHPDQLEQPLKWKKSRRIFTCSMSDIFHDDVRDEWIDKILLIILLSQEHTFILLTKRPEIMKAYFCNPETPHRIAKLRDEYVWREKAKLIPLETKVVDDYPDYLVRNDGIVFSTHGSSNCVYCNSNTSGFAKSKYCSQKCKEKAQYIHLIKGEDYPYPPTPSPMNPDISEDGHMRVMLYKDGKSYRELVHRLVLTAFDRPPRGNEEGMHSDGNPRHNHIANLSWGTQSDNWADRLRHGRDIKSGRINGGKHGIEWPLSNIFCGVTTENQQRADERIPILLQIPAAVRFVSVEPMLSPVDLFFPIDKYCTPAYKKIDWVICAPETGPKRRPYNIEWIVNLKNQCVKAGTPFFLKHLFEDKKKISTPELDGQKWVQCPQNK